MSNVVTTGIPHFGVFVILLYILSGIVAVLAVWEVFQRDYRKVAYLSGASCLMVFGSWLVLHLLGSGYMQQVPLVPLLQVPVIAVLAIGVVFYDRRVCRSTSSADSKSISS